MKISLITISVKEETDFFSLFAEDEQVKNMVAQYDKIEQANQEAKDKIKAKYQKQKK